MNFTFTLMPLCDDVLTVSVEPCSDSVSVHSGVESLFPRWFCGCRARSVCSEHGILSPCCLRLSVAIAAHEAVSTVFGTTNTRFIFQLNFIFTSCSYSSVFVFSPFLGLPCSPLLALSCCKHIFVVFLILIVLSYNVYFNFNFLKFLF